MTGPRRPAARNALAVLTEAPWAILPSALETMVAIARRENAPVEAIEAERGEPLEHAHTVTVRDGVARIPVEGPLFRRADIFARISGATSYDTVARDLTAALGDPTVRAIVLDVDSPGGEVAGCNELAGMIRAARGVKPITAYVSGHACSAAYWLASACDEVIVAPTAIVGSIGACITYVDDAGYLEKEGLRRIKIVSSQSPRKNRDPATEEGRSDVQLLLDAIAEVFIATVAENREVSVDVVLERYGQGGVMVGAEAVAAGLSDALGSYEEVLHALAEDAGDDAATGVRLVASATTDAEAARGGPNTQAKETDMAKRTLRAARRLMAGAGANGPGAANEDELDEDEETTTSEEEQDEEEGAEDDDEEEEESAAEDDEDEDEETAEDDEEEEEEPAAANARERRLVAAGARRERERLASIDALAIAGHSKLVARAKREGWSVAKASRRILAAEKQRQGDQLAAMRSDMPKERAPRGFVKSPAGKTPKETANFILNAGRAPAGR